ncbi:MAG: hypothetical protein IPQ07_41290, partial [Myxococcales bacterium]|nr:hypothetical protein [Myxococcales bacterium]
MTADVATVGPDVMLSVVARKLAERRISALAVVDDKAPAGRDLAHRSGPHWSGQAGTHRKASALTLPEKR